jgi:hypothetical protein
MVLDSLGLTVADLEAAGADPYDLEALRAPRLETTTDAAARKSRGRKRP